jgi:transcriptional regulator with XRE-family HTH domain
MSSDIEALSANLRYLCAHYGSVAEVCRRLGINRQQFNKYLNGSSAPSLRNLRRISTFFGVDEYEITLAHEDFVSSVMPRRGNPSGAGDLLSQLLSQLSIDAIRSRDALKPYCGVYAVYLCTPVWSSHIVRSLTVLKQQGQNTVLKSIERLRMASSPGTSLVQKFIGAAFYVVDRIYILEYEAASRDLVSLTILYPSHRQQRPYLTGIILTIASGGNRQPFASRVVYERLGPNVDFREELRKSNVYPMESGELAPEVRARLNPTHGLLSEVLIAPGF